MIALPGVRSGRSCGGFTLAELMIVVAVIGLVASIAFNVSSQDWRRARLNRVVQEASAWLESIRKAAQRTQSGCVVTVNTLANQSPGSVLATVSNRAVGESSCGPEANLLFNADSPGDLISAQASSATVIFTPRGTIVGASSAVISSDWEWRFALSSVSALRCIRLSGLLGAIQIGSSDSTSNVASSCSTYTVY